jgi:hypothetical protein
LSFQRDQLLAGRVPLWNPYLLCGTPFVGNPQAWPLYPSSALLYGLEAPVAASVIAVGHLALAAVGTLLFLRRRGRTVWAALLGGVAWGFGGALVSKTQFPNMVQAAAFLPWLLWAMDGLILRTTPARTATLALLVGLALLAAHAQVFLMTFYLCGAYAAWHVWPRRGTDRKRTARRSRCGVRARFAAERRAIVAGHGPCACNVRARLTLGRADRFTLPSRAWVAELCRKLLFWHQGQG